MTAIEKGIVDNKCCSVNAYLREKLVNDPSNVSLLNIVILWSIKGNKCFKIGRSDADFTPRFHNAIAFTDHRSPFIVCQMFDLVFAEYIVKCATFKGEYSLGIDVDDPTGTGVYITIEPSLQNVGSRAELQFPYLMALKVSLYCS